MCKRCLVLLVVGMMVCTAGCRGNDISQTDEAGIQTEEIKTQEDEEVEIELPKQPALETDYTAADGLILQAGTRIAVVAKNVKADYWQAVRTGMQKAIDDLNLESGLEGEEQVVMTFEGPDESDDAETQINTIDEVLAENPQVLCLSAIDMMSCAPQLEMAKENGIPVIMFDSSVRMDDLAYTVCKTDNYKAGVEAATHLAENAPGLEQVLIVASSQYTESIKDRILGFENGIVNQSDVFNIYKVYADDEDELGDVKERLQEMLDANPEITACFATDEAMAKEVLEVLKSPRYEYLSFVGFDAGKEQQDAIREGKELGMVCQNPYGMGYATIISAARAVLGLENDEIIDAGYQWIDSSNIDQEENQKYLYE